MAMGSRSSVDLHPWARWLLPSIGDLLFVALLGLLAFSSLSTRLLGDAGIGWHIRTGQLILANHAVPHVDPFSTSSGQPWFAWEWLYDLLAGWLDSAAGLNGVVLFASLVIASTFAWTFRLLLRRGTNLLLALFLVLLAASASMIHFFARPHVASWLFTVAWFWILEAAEHGDANPDAADPPPVQLPKTRLLWLLPLSMLLWVNLHGGFLIGFVLLAIYWFGALWQSWRLKEDHFDEALRKIAAGKRARILALVGVFSAAATLINPYGFKLHLHIYRYLSNRFLMDHIDEFQSPNFHLVAQKCFGVLLLLTLVALGVKSERRIGINRTLVVLFAVYSGLYAARNIPVSSLLLILIIGPRLSDVLQAPASRWPTRFRARVASFLCRMHTIEFSVHGHLWPTAAGVLTCWIAAHGGQLGATPVMDAHFNPKRFPAAAVDSLQKRNLAGPFLSTDYWGGYLIYRLYPRTQVVVDDRHDFYGEEFLKSYLKMVHVEPGWEDFIRQHPPSYILLPKDSALTNILLETPDWKSIYSDDVTVAFVPAAPQR